MRRSRQQRPTTTWPSWRYGPNGESGIFNSAEEVPFGWVKKFGDLYEAPVSTQLDRDTLIALLQDRGVVVKGNWSAAYMKELLEQ